MAEDAKIATRNIRQDYMKKIDNAEKAKEISEDIAKSKKSELQRNRCNNIYDGENVRTQGG